MPAIHQFSRSAFEAEAQQLRLEFLKLCESRNSDSAAVVAAAADIVATVAAVLDKRNGAWTLNDKLDSFAQRTEETYTRLRDTAGG